METSFLLPKRPTSGPENTELGPRPCGEMTFQGGPQAQVTMIPLRRELPRDDGADAYASS